jgi:hypothetical protein
MEVVAFKVVVFKLMDSSGMTPAGSHWASPTAPSYRDRRITAGWAELTRRTASLRGATLRGTTRGTMKINKKSWISTGYGVY